jgi:acyl carrier protein phosphodiesterase
MNLLAHAYLSFNDADILLGNMISDFVKGKSKFEFPINIQKGIQIHRDIDDFTDSHKITKEIKEIFKPAYRLYAGAFVDVSYDYFLANDTNQFDSKNDLQNFTSATYQLLEKNTAHFPEKFARSFPFMKQNDWLYHYHSHEGMKKSFGGLAKRAKYIEEIETGFQLFLENEDLLQEAYDLFFPQLKTFIIEKTNTF